MKRNVWKIGLFVIIVLILSALFFHYIGMNRESEINVNGRLFDTKSVTKYLNNNVSNDAEKVSLEFYQHYLKNVYGKEVKGEVPTIVFANGNYRLDSTQYENFLNDSGYFSKLFYQNQLPKFNACNSALKEVSQEEVAQSGGSATDFVKTDDCAFLTSNQWIGGQGEELDTAQVQSSKVGENNAEVHMVIGQKLNETYSYNYSYPVVTLADENGQWKITDITLSFERP